MFKIKTIKLFLIMGVLMFSLNSVSCSSNKNDNANVDEHITENERYYMDVIDVLSSIAFDYQKPNYCYVSLNIVNNYIYTFGSEQAYELISTFDNVSIHNNADTELKKAELTKKMANSINFEVSYKYITSSTNNDDAIVHFYVLEDGTLLFEDSRNVNWFYSDKNIVDYNELENKITEMSNNQMISNTKTYYSSYSFNNITNWPAFIGDEYNLSFGERKYNFVLSFSTLDDIFVSSTGFNTLDYFNENIFEENVVLCVVRDETGGTADVKYYNFKIDGLKLSIEEELVGGGAEVVSRYLDFVIIPKSEIPNGELNIALEYYWS